MAEVNLSSTIVHIIKLNNNIIQLSGYHAKISFIVLWVPCTRYPFLRIGPIRGLVQADACLTWSLFLPVHIGYFFLLTCHGACSSLRDSACSDRLAG